MRGMFLSHIRVSSICRDRPSVIYYSIVRFPFFYNDGQRMDRDIKGARGIPPRYKRALLRESGQNA